jgi:hypothetical protein
MDKNIEAKLGSFENPIVVKKLKNLLNSENGSWLSFPDGRLALKIPPKYIKEFYQNLNELSFTLEFKGDFAEVKIYNIDKKDKMALNLKSFIPLNYNGYHVSTSMGMDYFTLMIKKGFKEKK